MLSLKDVFEAQASTTGKRVVIYGDSGVGKTTLAVEGFDRPVVMRFEDGLGKLNVPTFPLITSAAMLNEALLALDVDNSPFKTVIFDSLDWLEPLIWRQVCSRARVENIADLAYGKGYEQAAEVWRRLLAIIEGLRIARGYNIVLLCHAGPVQVDLPDQEVGYQKMDLKLHKKAASLVKEWADVIGYLRWKVQVVKGEKANKAKSAVREVLFTGATSYVAKSRFEMPDQVELSTIENCKGVF